jgi:hypothetical protein
MDRSLNGNIISLLNDYKFKCSTMKDESEPEDLSIINNVKIVGIYFGNTMSAQCRAYTKALRDLYKSVNKDKKVFEVIFITNEDEYSIRESLNRMPWYYREQDESDTKELRDFFNAYEVPKLGIFSNEGRILFINIHISKLNKDSFNRWIEKEAKKIDILEMRKIPEIQHK